MNDKNVLAVTLAAALLTGLVSCIPARATSRGLERPRRATTRPAGRHLKKRTLAPGLGAVARRIDRARPRRVISEEQRAERRVHEALRKRIPSVDFHETALEDAIAWVRDFSGLNVHVKWEMLALLGIDRGKEITLDVKDVTVEKALRMILADAGGPTKLGFDIDDGVLTVSTAEDLAPCRVTEVYDVRDIIGWPAQEEAERLIDFIVSNVAPGSWQGQVGSISHFKGILAVTQTPENQEQVARIVHRLKEMQAERPALPRAGARRGGAQLRLVGSMKKACFDPAAMGMIAVAGLREGIPRKGERVIDELENALKSTKSLGLRNAIRLALRDLYKARAKDEKALDQLRAMLSENDRALQRHGLEGPHRRPPCRRAGPAGSEGRPPHCPMREAPAR